MFYNNPVERRVSVRELNQQTSAVLAEVAAGGAVTVTSDGRPVARIVPMAGQSSDLDRRVAIGLATAPRVSGPIPVPPVLGDGDLDVAALLAEDRLAQRW
jgi:prevent-host-death family protein